jgi:L-rhamnose mutarotase
MTMQRYGSVLRMPPQNLERYAELHAAVWPTVLATITACNIRNYSIFHRGGWLFSYFEYVGDDFAADMRRMANDPDTQAWWAINNPLQEPLEDRAPGEWWAAMEELFHLD